MNTKLTLALAAALLPTLSLAADPVIYGKSATTSVVVRYGDLDLSTQKGTQALHARLNNAAWLVCEKVVDQPVSIDGSKCRAQLVEDAQQKALGH
jgi:UrcA family protein